MTEFASIGIKLETNGLAQGARTLEQLAAVGPKVERSIDGIERAAGKSVKQLKNLGDGANGAAGELGKLKKNAEDAERATIGVGDAMGALRAAVLGAGLVGLSREYLSLADAATNVQSRLKLVTDSTRELVAAQNSLFKAAQDARVSYTGLVDTYAQMARSTKELGISQREMMGVTETISKAVTISGASAASANAALVQLSQGFASGALRGEELNSVMEQTPRLAMAIANGLGIGIGKLREMGQAGELTAEKVVKALQNSAGDVAAEFEQMAITVEQATTTASNSLVRLVGVFDQVTGVSGAAAVGIGRFATGFDTLADSIKGMAESNSLDDFFTSAFQSNANLNAELKISEAEMAKLTARLAKAPDNIYVRSQIAELQKYIAGLKEAQARLAALTGASVSGGATDPRDQSQFTSRGASYANYAKQQEAARQALLEISAKSNGITKQFSGDLKAYEEALRTGVISTNDYVKAVTELNKKRYESTEAGKAEAKAAKDAAKGSKEGTSAILSYIKSLEARTAAQRLEIAQGEKLTESQRARIQLEGILGDAKTKASKSQIAYAQGLLTEAEANEAWLTNTLAVEKALGDMQKAREQSLSSVQDSVRKLVEEAEAAAFAEANNVSLAEAIERLALARAENAYQQAVERQEGQQSLDYLRQEITARKELVTATAQKGVKEANKKAAEQAAKDWEKVSQTIGDTLADYIMGGGKDAATYLKRLFSTLVLQPVVQYGVNSAMGALGMGQQGSAVNSVLGGNNVGTTVLNNAGAIGAGFQAMYGMSVGASSASLLGANAVGMVGGDALGTLAAANGMWAGVATGAQAAAQSAIAANVAMEAGTAVALEAGTLAAAQGAATGAAAGASSIMSGIAAAGPWIAAAAALYGVIKSLDDSGTPHIGAGAVYSGGKLQEGADIYNHSNFGMGSRGGWNANTQQNASGIAASLGAALDVFAVSFGQKAGYTVATAFADDSSKDGAWGSLKIADDLGRVLVDWENTRRSKWAPREFADGEKGYKEYLTAVAVDVKSAFLAMDIPAWGKQLVDAATDLDSLSAALAQVGAVKTVLDSLGKSLSMFADLSGEAQTTLLSASGGIDALAQNASSFYQGFYTEQERYENSRKQMQEVLAGLDVSIDPAMGDRAKAEFRAAVSAAFDAGQFELGAQLLGINQQFATLADYAQKASVAVEDVGQVLSDVMSDVMRDLLDDRKSLEADLLRAQGDESGYLAAVRAIATAGYAEAEIAAWDYNTALQAQIDALDAAGSRMQALSAIALQQSQSYLSAAQNAASGAWANFEAAIGREKTYWGAIAASSQTALSALSSTLSMLESNAAALYGSVDASQQTMAAQGMVYVEGALAAVRGGGDIKGFSGLEDAISAARAGISSDGYATQFERERDTLVLAGQLSELGDLTDVQLSVQERQLKAAQSQIEQIDQTLDFWRESFNYDQLQIDATLSIGGAISVLAASITAQKAAQAAAQSAQWNNSIVSATPAGEWDKAALYSQMASSGMSDSQIREQVGKATGNYQADSDWDYLKKLAGVPGFASGGLHSGGLRLVGERGPELEVTGPARYWDAGKTMQMLQGSGSGGNTERLERLVEGLTAEVQRLQLLVNEGNRYAGQTADILDRVTEGGNGMRADVINTSLRVETA